MTNPPPFSSFYVKEVTFTDDAAHRIEENPEIVLSSINIHIYDNDAFYGNSLSVSGIIRANAVVWFDSACRPFDLVFKNYTAGSNITVVVTGPVLKRG
jgi:hypothetical protein